MSTLFFAVELRVENLIMACLFAEPRPHFVPDSAGFGVGLAIEMPDRLGSRLASRR